MLTERQVDEATGHASRALGLDKVDPLQWEITVQRQSGRVFYRKKYGPGFLLGGEPQLVGVYGAESGRFVQSAKLGDMR